MEIQLTFTGTYRMYHKNFCFNTIKEIISLIKCDDFYIIMRVTKICNSIDIVPVETKQYTDISQAYDLYNKWHNELLAKMINEV